MSLVYGLDKEREEIEYNKIYHSHFLTIYGRASRARVRARNPLSLGE